MPLSTCYDEMSKSSNNSKTLSQTVCSAKNSAKVADASQNQSKIDRYPISGYNNNSRRNVLANKNSFGGRGNGRGGGSRDKKLRFPRTDHSEQVEIGSISRPGSKKGFLASEFLNFSYDFSNNDRQQNRRQFHYDEPANRFSHRSTVPSYNKEQHLQANCQFFVAENFNFSANLLDPDLPIDWNCVEEVRLFDEQVPTCPICLYPPTAAQITRCGHVFCWPCVLHYLALSDKQWRKCPICYESIYKNQLRSVVSQKTTRFCDRATIALRLMRRDKASNVARPTSAAIFGRNDKIAKCGDEFARFCKLVVLTADETKSRVIVRERGELMRLLRDEANSPESCFITEALEALGERELTLMTAEHMREIPGSHVGSPREEATQVNADSKKSEENNACCSQENEKSYYFYQVDDGQLIFLHPVNAHCLIEEYGGLQYAPEKISGTISQIDYFTMCPELKKRYRYLSHLPLTSVFALVEIKFNENICSKVTLDLFYEEFEKRKILRDRKEKDAEKLQKRAERWEKVMLLDPNNYLKYIASPTEEPKIPTYVQSAQNEIDSRLVTDQPISGETEPRDSPEATRAPSFAQMLKSGKPRTSSDEAASSRDSNSRQPMENRDDDDDKKGAEFSFATLSHYRSEFGDAFQAALDDFRANGGATTTKSDENDKKTKKKKNKGKILFSL